MIKALDGNPLHCGQSGEQYATVCGLWECITALVIADLNKYGPVLADIFLYGAGFQHTD